MNVWVLVSDSCKRIVVLHDIDHFMVEVSGWINALPPNTNLLRPKLYFASPIFALPVPRSVTRVRLVVAYRQHTETRYSFSLLVYLAVGNTVVSPVLCHPHDRSTAFPHHTHRSLERIY